MKLLLVFLFAAVCFTRCGGGSEGETKTSPKPGSVIRRIGIEACMPQKEGDTSSALICRRAEVQDFDKNSKMVQRALFRTNGTVQTVYRYNLDENGEVREKIIQLQDEGIMKKQIYNRDAGGRVEIMQMEPKPEVRVNTLIYDSAGNMVESIDYNKSGAEETHKSAYRHDDKGNVIEERSFDYLNDSRRKFVFEYDNGGNKKTARIYDTQDSLIVEMVYEYLKKDAAGNWTECIEVDGHGNRQLIKRHIEYY